MEGSNDRPGVMQARPDISTSTPSMKYRVVGKRCLSSLFEDSDHDDDDDDKSPKVRRRDLGPDIGGFELLDAVREDYEAAATARYVLHRQCLAEYYRYCLDPFYFRFSVHARVRCGQSAAAIAISPHRYIANLPIEPTKDSPRKRRTLMPWKTTRLCATLSQCSGSF